MTGISDTPEDRMRMAIEFLIAPDQSAHRVAVLHTTKDDLDKFTHKLSELEYPWMVFNCADQDFDACLLTNLGDFLVVYDEDKK